MINYEFILYSSLKEGGRESWLKQFLPRLPLSDDVKVFYFTDEDIAIDSDGCNSIKYLPIQIPKRKRFVSSLKRTLSFIFGVIRARSTEDASVIISVGSYVEMIAAYCRACLSKKAFFVVWIRSPVTLQLVGRFPKSILWLLGLIEVLVLKKADLVITNGHDTHDIYLLKDVPSTVNENAVDVNKFLGAVEKRRSLGKPVVVGYFGRLSREKGFLSLIEAIKILAKNSDKLNVHFLIAGSGELSADAIGLAREYDFVRIIGHYHHDEVPGLLAQVDASLNLTYGDVSSGYPVGSGVSNSLLESLAAGVIPICWDNILSNNVCDKSIGVMAGEGDATDLANAIRKVVLMDDQEYSKRSVLAVNRAKDFSWESHLQKFHEAIDQLVKK